MNCHICNHNLTLFATAQIANRHKAHYYKCDFCNHIQTEKPYWLDRDYSEPINQSDIGLASRNILLAKKARAIISVLFNRRGIFMDYAGGYGLFVRLMRDYGLDFFRCEKYCPNLFAQGFDADDKEQVQYEMVTAFEVFEHFEKPLEEIDNMLKFSRSILFTTELVPVSFPKPGEWWYYGLDHGQHISLYSQRSLAIIAQKFHLQLYSDGKSLHLLTEKKFSPFLFTMLTKSCINFYLDLLFPSKTLLASDYKKLYTRSE